MSRVEDCSSIQNNFFIDQNARDLVWCKVPETKQLLSDLAIRDGCDESSSCSR